MLESKTSQNFIKALTAIYNLEIINELLDFLQGEQAVMFAIKMSGFNKASDIASKLNITKSRMTIIINNLIKKNYLISKVSNEDKRVKLLEFTKLGQNYIDKKELEAILLLNIYMEKMGESKINTFTNLLEETVKIMKEE